MEEKYYKSSYFLKETGINILCVFFMFAFFVDWWVCLSVYILSSLLILSGIYCERKAKKISERRLTNEY